jgi:hypothetical protein
MEDPILAKGSVKDWEAKVKNIGRPSIFVGSSRESMLIAERVRKGFPEDEFVVDPWYSGVFGKTRSSGGDLSNAEWLKNFTDIYDYAIFIFAPDDEMMSLTRFDMPDGTARNAVGTRHNVVYEFGLFMGRIGAKKTFILFDEAVEDFIKLFFTDLVENLNDTAARDNSAFRIELYPYKGNYLQYRKNKDTELPYEDVSIGAAIDKITEQVKTSFNDVEISFLPSTSLAIGYFNNCVSIFANIVHVLKNDLPYPAKWKQDDLKEEEFNKLAEKIKHGGRVKLKIVIPESLEGAIQGNFTKDFPKDRFQTKSFPGANRPLTLACHTVDIKETSESLTFYDVPTTMNSSLEAINMVTEHYEIRELLKEKERRNFKKALEYKIALAREQKTPKDIDSIIEIISWKQFIQETS